MKKDYIVVIDSGIGGLSTLAECIKKQNNYNYLYVSDNKHCPYGAHSNTEIQSFLSEIIVKLRQKCSFSIVLLACNTATTTSIEHLRNTFKDIHFIGTEPAINLANKLSFKNILALTTPATARQKKFIDLKSKQSSKISVLAISTLAKNIENYFANKSYFSYAELLKDVMKVVTKSQNYDSIVLGCTHYVFIKNLLQKFTKIPTIDGNAGVCKELARRANILGVAPQKKHSVKFLNTKDIISINQNNKKILSQILANAENLW